MTVVEDGRFADEDARLSPARGIVTAMILSIPFWALFGFALYLIW